MKFKTIDCEKLFVFIDKGLILRIYILKKLQLNVKNTKNPIKAWAKDQNRYFTKEGQKADGNILNIISHQRNDT